MTKTDELMALAKDSQGFGWNVTKKQLRTALEQALEDARMDGVRQGAEWGVAKTKADAQPTEDMLRAGQEALFEVCPEYTIQEREDVAREVWEAMTAAAIRKGEGA